jgi:GTP-binding protein
VLQGTLRKSQDVNRLVTRWKDANPAAKPANAHHDDFEIVGTSPERINYLWVTRGLDTVAVDEVVAGDIVTVAGPDELFIGDTISAPEPAGVALPPLEIEEPTVSMLFLVNSGPFAGREGQAVTIRQIKARLERELRTNIALRMEDVERGDGVKVSGRGELHLAILIEEMRREGMELCVSPPEVITHTDEDGRLMEPVEELTIDVPFDYQGVIIEKVSQRKGELTHMCNEGRGMVRLEFKIPTRGLIGYRNEFLTDTRGLGIMASRFVGYGPWAGDIVARSRGSMVSMSTGDAASYSLENLQERGTLFVSPMDPIYAGMIVGEHARPDDLPCNPTKRKALTNHRASTKDQTVTLDVPRKLTLDSALEWIAPDELLEVTPKTVRPRKAIIDAEERKREFKRRAAG